MATALISLGSNLGDRAATLASALAAIEATPDVRVVRTSSFYETTPVGGPGFQESFLNGAAQLETTLEPESLLDVLQRVENDHGRVREEHWGPRTLDLDLLTYDDVVLHTSRLTLPHPRMSYRKFVLDGVVEIAPRMRHPLIDQPYSKLLRHLETAPNYVAFVGPNFADDIGFRSQFAAEAADCAAARLVDATPSDVPAFADLLASPSLDGATTIKFIQARDRAIRESLADAGEKWVVDDGWVSAEANRLLHRIGSKETYELVGQESGDAPKLLALLRAKNETPAAAIAALTRILNGVPWLPIIDLDFSDRERALTDFAAALDAAR